jgi:transcriptional regulator with XRE-family HTH domain
VGTISTKHIGQNVLRIRELRGLKQDALAFAIGLSQQTISNIEKSDAVDESKLELIAQELNVTVEAIKNFSEESLVDYLNSLSTAKEVNEPFSFGLDKFLEIHENNRKLYEQKEILYERLLQSEKEKTAYLEKLTGNKNITTPVV